MFLLLKLMNRVFNFFRLLPSVVRYKYYQRVYSVRSSFFRGVDTIIYGKGHISVDDISYCGDRCAFQLSKNHSITIGNRVSISHNVRIYTETDDTRNIILGLSNRVRIFGDVKIGDNVWIGANVFINPGITIGSNSVIGANSVVTKDIPSGTVNAGCPARILKRAEDAHE
jgi:maltose O-acetyltransferase